MLKRTTIVLYEQGGEGSVQNIEDKMDMLIRGRYSSGTEGPDGQEDAPYDINDAAETLVASMKIFLLKNQRMIMLSVEMFLLICYN